MKMILALAAGLFVAGSALADDVPWAFGITVGGQAIGVDPVRKVVKVPPGWTVVEAKSAKIEAAPVPKLASHAANCSCGAACDCPTCDGSCPKAAAGVTYMQVCEGGVCRLVPASAPRTLSYSGPLVSGGVTVGGGGCADGSCGTSGGYLFPRLRGAWENRPRLFFGRW